MRSTALWTISFFGLAGVAAVTFIMLYSLERFGGSTAGDRVKLANSVIRKFKLNVASASIQTKKTADTVVIQSLKIEYKTDNDSGFDQAVMDSEMERIAKYAIEEWNFKEIPVESIAYERPIPDGDRVAE